LAGIRLGIGNDLGDCLGWKRCIDHHDKRPADKARDRRDVADEIETEFVVESRVTRIPRSDQKERVAVRWRSHDRLSADIAASARSILNDEWLAEALRQPLAHYACDDVGRATGRSRQNQVYRPRWIGLRPCEAWQNRKRGSARDQMQQFAAGKFHVAASQAGPKC